MDSAADDESPPPNLRRAGHAWSDAEDESLVLKLRQGLTMEDIAESHGRTVGAMRARATRMVPEDEHHPTSAAGRIEFLRAQLADGDYDWRTPLQSRSSAHAWRPAEDHRLEDGWVEQTPLVDLADALSRSEPMLVRRLLQLGLATDLLEIVDRLGCDPRGPLAFRVVIARGAAGPIVHVLLGIDERGRPSHVSLHESAEAAESLKVVLSGEEGDVDRLLVIEREIGGPGYADPSAGFGVQFDAESTDSEQDT